MDEYVAIAKFAHFAAIFILFGTSLFRLYALGGPGAITTSDEFDRWCAKVLRIAAVVALLSALLWWDAIAGLMGDAWSHVLDVHTLGTVLFDTQFGRTWQWRLVLAAILVLIPAAPLTANRLRNVGITALSAALIVGVVNVTHAAMHQETEGTIHRLSDAAHLLCAATWLGGLLPLGYVMAHARRDAAWLALARRAVPRFSRVGYVAVVLLLLSGCVNAYLLAGTWQAWTYTAYGQVLIAKIALFLCMLAIAAGNRVLLAPRILNARDASASQGASTRLMLTITVELSLGVLVLVLVAVLGQLVPPH